MNNIGFMSGGGPGLRKGPGGGGSAEGPEKIDMSLDDIIRLNRREKRPVTGSRKTSVNGRFPQGRSVGSWAGGPSQRGGGVARLGVRGRKTLAAVGRRRGQGVITGLAARRSNTLRKGISPLNRPTLTPVIQKPRPLLQHSPVQHRQMDVQTQQHRLADLQKGQSATMCRPVQLRRQNVPPPPHIQKDARQATFLFRRGLKVQTRVQHPTPLLPVVPKTRPWRTLTTSSGILTVSIDNPTARTQPEPPRAWSLHPPITPPLTVKQEEEERKPPKGVVLQFDINSVGKQTGLTLSERFRILKDQRVASAPGGKAGRFVTVG